MSLENDVSKLQEADVFKPASQEELVKRKKDYIPPPITAENVLDWAGQDASLILAETIAELINGTYTIEELTMDINNYVG